MQTNRFLMQFGVGLTLFMTSFFCEARNWYVTPIGVSSANGNSYTTAVDIKTAFAGAAAGDVVLLQAGTYKIANTGSANGFTMAKTGTASAPIRIEGDGGQAIVNFQYGVNAYLKDDHGLYVTGSYYYFKNIMITQAGYNGAYVTGAHNTFDNCVFYNNRNTGLEINKGGSYTTVLNCDAYYNYDLRRGGGMADGFGPKQTMGAGNVFTGCRSWENSDDGFDLFDSPQKVILKNCWTFRNGKNVYTGVTQWGTKDGTGIDGVFKGNGNGFKLGGNDIAGDHEVYNCVSFENVVKGFDQNSNTGSVLIYNSTGYNNGTYNFAFGGTLNSGEKLNFRNNLSVGSPSGADVKNATQLNNSWNLSISAGTADFVNLTTSLAKVARNADGSLPYTGLFVPTATSKVVDKGVNVNLPYCGAAPELGAFEIGCKVAPVVRITAPANNTTLTAPANFTISVAASDVDGTVTYVDIYNGTRKVVKANLTNGVYSIDRTNVSAGTYIFTAEVTDNEGNTTTSAPITVIVTGGNVSPVVNMSSPANNANFTAPASINLAATASDADGTLAKVEFYSGSTLLGAVTANGSTYSYSWANIAAGTYTVTAKATDDKGETTSSSPITITVSNPTQTISLAQGWNLISINLRPSDSTIATLFKGLDVVEIKDMNSFWRNAQADVFNTLKSITVANGYLLNMNTAGTLTVSGIPVPTRFIAPQLASWQLIGCSYQQATAISSVYNASNCSAIKNFEGFWLPNGTGNSVLNMEPGKAYFIKK